MMISWVWLPAIPVGVFSILLTVLGSIVAIVEFKGLARIALVALFILLGLGEFVAIMKSDSAHEIEVRNQHTDIENLRGDLQKSETDRRVGEAYLKAKLEDSFQMNAQLAQLGPALMKLAQTSAEFERKQYETKITSNKELHDFTLGVVTKIRDFSQKYSTLQRQQSDQMMSARRQAQSDTERDRIWNEAIQKDIQLYSSRDAEFRSSILPDAQYARNELLKKKVEEPAVTPMIKSEVEMVLRGILAGPYPELALADYLELMAKELPAK